MLDKMKVILIAGLVLQLVRAFLPDLNVPTEFQPAVETLINSVYVIVPVVLGWFKKESEAQIAKLKTVA